MSLVLLGERHSRYAEGDNRVAADGHGMRVAGVEVHKKTHYPAARRENRGGPGVLLFSLRLPVAPGDCRSPPVLQILETGLQHPPIHCHPRVVAEVAPEISAEGRARRWGGVDEPGDPLAAARMLEVA